MLPAPSFESNSEITPAVVAAAVESRNAFRAFLERAAAVSAPLDGGPKILMACAALSTCAWVDGELHVELEGDESETRLALLLDIGFREHLFPVTHLRVPFDEFVRALRLAPQLLTPLSVREQLDTRLLLTAPSRLARQSPANAKMPAVRDDVHTKPTVVRMTAVRPEALPPKDDEER